MEKAACERPFLWGLACDFDKSCYRARRRFDGLAYIRDRVQELGMEDLHSHESVSLLVLQNLPNTAAHTLQKLFSAFDTLAGILAASSEGLSNCLDRPILEIFDDYRRNGLNSQIGEKAARDNEYMQGQGLGLITFGDRYYPSQLREIYSAPPILMVEGNPEILAKEQLAIVGSRRASHSGIEIAGQFAQELAASGLVVTSGLAVGIDAAAHRGALSVDQDLNPHPTVAVVATGLDLCYPVTHEGLRTEISRRGAVVSEFPLGTPPRKENFPRRNRIISGLTKGVLVVEAELKSGSLITARYALEQNREVFAVPGHIHNPGSRGCHRLIRDGARLTESVDDILTELRHPFGQIAISFKEETRRANPDLDKDEKTVIACMDENPVSADSLARRATLPIEQILSILMGLELKGFVILTAGGYQKNDLPR